MLWLLSGAPGGGGGGGLLVGFRLHWYSVLFTVDSLVLLCLLYIS